ncbi:MAG: hypothetical protein QXF04_02165 [Candidatus Aenigmatarchaeota archaeon]
MKVFWFVYGLGLLLHLYLIFVQELYNLLPNLSTYSLFGIFAYSLEKSLIKKEEKRKIEMFEE